MNIYEMTEHKKISSKELLQAIQVLKGEEEGDSSEAFVTIRSKVHNILYIKGNYANINYKEEMLNDFITDSILKAVIKFDTSNGTKGFFMFIGNVFDWEVGHYLTTINCQKRKGFLSPDTHPGYNNKQAKEAYVISPIEMFMNIINKLNVPQGHKDIVKELIKADGNQQLVANRMNKKKSWINHVVINLRKTLKEKNISADSCII